MVICCHPAQDKRRNTRNKQRVQTELFICMYVCIWYMAYMILRQYLKLMHHPSNSSAWPQCCQCLFSFNSMNHFYFCCSGLRKELLPSWPVCPQERDGETCLALHSGRAAATSQQQRSDARWWVRVWVPQGSNKQKNDVVFLFNSIADVWSTATSSTSPFRCVSSCQNTGFCSIVWCVRKSPKRVRSSSVFVPKVSSFTKLKTAAAPPVKTSTGGTRQPFPQT